MVLGRVRLVGSVVLVLLTTGCAGITNSQVRWPSATPEQRKSFDEAMKYADVAKDRYRDALGNQSKLTRLLGATLIPFGAAAGGIAATGGSSVAVVALLSAAAGGIAEVTWLTSKPEQRAWAAGYNAITCAQTAVEPLRIAASAQDGSNALLDERERTVRNALAGLDEALVAARRALEAYRAIADTAAAERSLASAETTRQTANDTLANAERLRQEAARIPSQLIDTVDNIGGQVAVALTDQGPDIQALARLVSGLAQGYGQFLQVPAKGAAPKDAPAKAQAGIDDAKLRALADAFQRLELKRLELDRATRALADRVNAVAATKPLDRLQACGVNTEKLAAPFTIEPGGPLLVTLGRPTTAGFVIRGGSPPFAVNLEGSSLDGLTVQHRDPMSPAFLVQATDKVTQSTSAVIHVADRSGRDQFLEISVTAAGAGARDSGSGTGTAAAIARKLADAPTKLVNQTRIFGANTVRITQASHDQTGNILNVGVKIDGADNQPLTKAAAETSVENAKNQILEWIAGLLGDASLGDSMKLRAVNP